MTSSNLNRLRPLASLALAAFVLGCDGPSQKTGGNVYGGEGSVIKPKDDAAPSGVTGGGTDDGGIGGGAGAGVPPSSWPARPARRVNAR
jgi:hypothetical protein